MSFIVARYNNKLGYLINVANAPTYTGFKTNTSYYKVDYNLLESGKHVLAIPFYNSREVQIEKQYANSSFAIKLLQRTGNKCDRLRVLFSDLRWYLVDTSAWDYNLRHNAILRYGISNFDYIEYERSM